MNTYSSRKRASTAVVGAAAIALTVGALAQPAVAGAERVWDLAEYDHCLAPWNQRYTLGDINRDEYRSKVKACCAESGGDWNAATENCEAPPATAQSAPQAPWEAGRAPRPESAAGGQAPAQSPPPPATGGGTVISQQWWPGAASVP